MIADAERAAAAGEVKVKGRDCWWTVLVIDPLAVPLVRAVRPLPRVTPNALTALAVLVAAAAATAFALDHLVIGAILFQVSFLIDCMDGKLAHTRGLTNRYGSFIDAVGDGVRFVACTGGLVVSLASQGPLDTGWVVALAMFPTVHYVRLTTQAAWPDDQRSRSLVLRAAPAAVLRAAPGRLAKPATTVDTEAVAFTIGPLAGLPLEGILAAAAIDGARLSASLVSRVWSSTRSA
jgi:phosphatidylglycerophosphate synthase